MERGDLAEFGKKRNTDDDFPPHWKCGSENNNQLPAENELEETSRMINTFPKKTRRNYEVKELRK